MNEKKKSNLGLTILLIIIIIVLTGYICYDKVLVKPSVSTTDNVRKDVNNNSKVEKEKLSIDDDLVINLYNTFRMDKACYMNPEDLNSKNTTRLRLAYDNLVDFVKYESIDCSKIGGSAEGNSYCGERMTDEMTQAYISMNMEKFTEASAKNYTRGINSKDLKAKYVELFGSENTYKDESFGIGNTADPSCHVMHYDANNQIYAAYSCEGGGTCAGATQELVSAYKQANELFIKTKYNSQPDGSEKELIYEFKQDSKNSNYVFVKAELK